MKKRLFKIILSTMLSVTMLMPSLSGFATVSAATTTEATTEEEPVVVKAEFDTTQIPAYTTASGVVSSFMEYDGGNGVARDGSKSYMRMVSSTTLAEFNTYVDTTLKSNGYTQYFENSLQSKYSTPNQFRRFLSKDGDHSIYVYYAPTSDTNGDVRIIVDTYSQTLDNFSYNAGYSGGGSVTYYLYGITMGEVTETVEDLTSTNRRRNCGQMIIIKMPDNSLFINDGGDYRQMGDEACAELLRFCREITGTPEGEKVLVNTWFLSHAHSDHMSGFPRFLSIYHDQIDLKNIMYNVESEYFDENGVPTSITSTRYFNMIKSYYPDIQYHKPHTGEKYNIAGVTAEVLYTPEDRYTTTETQDIALSTEFRKEDALAAVDTVLSDDFNDTSVVLRFTYGGKHFMLTADIYNCTTPVLLARYGNDVLKTDILQIPHHGINNRSDLCEAVYNANGEVAPTYTFYTQNKNAVLVDNDDTSLNERYNKMVGFLNAENILFGGSQTAGVEITSSGTMTLAYNEPVFVEPYTGWSVDGGTNIVVSDDYATERSSNNLKVSSTTRKIYFERATAPLYNKRFIMVHDSSDDIFMYNPVITNGSSSPNDPYSINVAPYAQAQANESNVAYYNDDESRLYISHDMRNDALWIAMQEITDKNGNGTDSNGDGVFEATINSGDELSSIWNEEELVPNIANNKRYIRVDFHKGYGPTAYYDDGTVKSSGNGVYWYSQKDNDSASTQWRFFYNYSDTSLFDTKIQSKLYMESFTDGTFIIYRRSSATCYRCFARDDDGTWTVIIYEGDTEDEVIEQVRANIDKHKIRLYEYKMAVTPTTVKTLTYYGKQEYTALIGTAKEDVFQTIADNITVEDSSRQRFHIPYSGLTPKIGYYWLDGDFSSSINSENRKSETVVKIKYRNDDGTDTLVGAVNLNIVDRIPLEASVNDGDNGIVPVNSSMSASVYKSKDSDGKITDCVMTVTSNTYYGVVTETVSVGLGMLTDSNGRQVLANEAGTQTGLTLTYNGKVITNNFTLEVVDEEEFNYPEYPDPGSVKVDKNGKAIGTFEKTGLGNIELSATGISDIEGVDMILMLDMSGSMSSGVNKEIATTETRIQALKDSLIDLMATLKGSETDFRVAMADFGDLDHYEFDDAVIDDTIRDKEYFDANNNKDINQSTIRAFGLDNGIYDFFNQKNFIFGKYVTRNDLTADDVTDIYDNRAQPYQLANVKYNTANPSYTGQVKPSVYTGSRMVGADAFVNVDEYTTDSWADLVNGLHQGAPYYIGTNYDIGLEYMYQLGYAIQQDNIENNRDREVVCVFMSDGHPMQYNYFSGRTVTSSWLDWFSGNIDPDKLQSNASTFTESKKPESLVTLENKLFELLKAGTLQNPDYAVTTTQDALNTTDSAGNALTINGNKAVTPVNKNGVAVDLTTINTAALVKSNKSNVYFNLEAKWNDNWQYLYTAMDGNNIHLDWDLYCRIASANSVTIPANAKTFKDIENVMYNDTLTLDQRLLSLAKSNKLKYPLECFYFDKYTGKSTNFYDAMEDLGYNYNWEQFVKIAEEQTSSATAENDKGNDEDLLALLTEVTALNDGYTHGTLSPYSYFYNEEGKNWWAEAIKGDPDKLYPVINKYAKKNNSNEYYSYYGDVRNNYDSGQGKAYDGKDYISGFRGLGMKIYTLGLSIGDEGKLTHTEAVNVLRNISSGVNFAYSAYSRDELSNAFKSIAASATTAATGAYYTDTMGDEYDLFTELDTDNYQNQLASGVVPKIRVLEYTLDNETHKRVGDPIVKEEVVFNVDANGDGTILKAKSNQVYNSEIIDDVPELTYTDIWDTDKGLIKGRYFMYNTNKDKSIKIDLTGDGVGDYTLAPETFFWIVGTIGQTEQVLEYQVYLSDAFPTADNVLPGVYDTNIEAPLGYVNYLGNNCMLYTESPAFPWQQARVGYGYYLVDKDGNPIVNQTTGATGDFDRAIKLTDPLYTDMVFSLNKDHTISANGHLPVGFKLYDEAAKYSVHAEADGTGYWEIIAGEEKLTTYVEGYGDIPTTIKTASTEDGKELKLNEYGTTDTVVWFAVTADGVYTIPDTVVADFGLPVDISVLSNDLLVGEGGTLSAIGEYRNDPANNAPDYATTLDGAFKKDYTGQYGTAQVHGSEVRYTLNTMAMSGTDKFSYAVNYSGNNGDTGYYYETVKVIPATSIYYEDSFGAISYETLTSTDNGENWTHSTDDWDEMVTDENYDILKSFIQSEDRPGEYGLIGIDADNIYGYDSVYDTSSMYSLGSAKKVTVNDNKMATATFNFSGTGFDVVSLTSSNTGTILVDIYKGDNLVAYDMVDTYYGYSYTDGEWGVNTEASDSIYQVPVIKIDDLDPGNYKAVITVAYSEYFDNKKDDTSSYDFYLDAIRVYNPAEKDTGIDDTDVKNAYIEDKELAPMYVELRNVLIDAEAFFKGVDSDVAGVQSGAILIDGVESLGSQDTAISDYKNYGPNNEVYLAPGQAVAFDLAKYYEGEALDSIHLAMKSTLGNAKVKVFTADKHINDCSVKEIKTATEMYYDMTDLKGNTVIIANVGETANNDGILSVTNFKFTFSEEDVNVNTSNLVTVAPASANNVLFALTRRATQETTTEPVTETTNAAESILIGDVDLNGRITVVDSTLIQKHIVNVQSLGENQLIAADCNCDGTINIKDATLIQKYAVGFEESGNVGEYVAVSE